MIIKMKTRLLFLLFKQEAIISQIWTLPSCGDDVIYSQRLRSSEKTWSVSAAATMMRKGASMLPNLSPLAEETWDHPLWKERGLNASSLIPHSLRLLLHIFPWPQVVWSLSNLLTWRRFMTCTAVGPQGAIEIILLYFMGASCRPSLFTVTDL